jgi:uncharacterized membrane protein
MMSPADKSAIESRVAELEAAHGIEIVTIVVGKSDVYPETVWKAFALGAAFTALVVAGLDLMHRSWTTGDSTLWTAVAILGIGALWALIAVYVPAVTRLFLRTSRAELEVATFADVQFLRRELFAKPARTTVLVLVSLLEQRVVIRADVGLQAKVTVAEWDAVIARMLHALRAGAPGTALLDGLAAMRELFATKGIAAGLTATPHENRFGDGPIEVIDP